MGNYLVKVWVQQSQVKRIVGNVTVKNYLKEKLFDYFVHHYARNRFFVLNRVKCLKQGIKTRNSVLKWVRKSAIFVLNRVRV